MNNIVIITSYIDSPLDISSVITAEDYIICTDGGYDIACHYNIVPHLLLGDFDSIRQEMPQDINIKRFPPEKDCTDLELALQEAICLGASQVQIIGGIGGRLDHTVANLQLLSQYSDSFNKITMFDGKNQCFIANNKQKDKLMVPREDNCYLSLFSLSEQCTGVTISGVKYPLTKYTLTRTGSLGVSNEFKEKNAVLSVEDGDLLVVLSKE